MNYPKKLIFSLSVFLSSSLFAQNLEEDFYKYGFPQDEIYVELDKAIKESKKVSKLKLLNVDLSKSLNKLGKFKQLKVLSLTNNKIDSLPDKLFRNFGMKSFFSSGNEFHTLSSNVQNWSELEVLKLQKTKLDAFPKELSSLKMLKKLELQSNVTDTFKLNDVFEGLEALEDLLFYRVPLYTFPSGFEHTKKLKQVYFIDCRLTKIDSSIYSCEQTELLVLDDNALKEIPEQIKKIKNLRVLSLRNNKIKALPEFISKFKKLEKLDVRGNPVPRHQIAILKILMPACRIDF